MASHGVARPAILPEKTEQSRLKEQRQINEYKELVELIELKITEREYTLEVLALTSKLLTRNPEYYTIWNVRRRLLTSGLFSGSSDSSLLSRESQNTSQIATTTTPSDALSSSSTNTSGASNTTPPFPASPAPAKNGKNGTTLDLIKTDLDFVFSLMLQFPKCYWLWNYRLWLLREGNARLGAGIARELWSRELVLVGKMLTRDNRNFHGWGYRRTVVAELESSKLQGTSMVESEFEYTTKMVRASLSNFSAWHTRSKLIPRLLNERNADDSARRKFLDDEFDLITQAMYTDAYPYAQSVWFYYQFLMTTLTEASGHAIITPNFTHADRISYVTSQLENLKEMLEGAEDCKWIYNALLEYTLVSCQMDNREPRDEEKKDARLWIHELRNLDPFRNGRWDDLESVMR